MKHKGLVTIRQSLRLLNWASIFISNKVGWKKACNEYFPNPSSALTGTFSPREKVLSRLGKWLKQ